MGRKRSLFKDDWEFDGVDGERNIGYGSRRSALLSIILSLCLVLISNAVRGFECDWRKLRDRQELAGG
jgi:hypothetical protein